MNDEYRGWASVWGQAAALSGAASLAITQPVLDLMGRNPEFFVAGRYTTAQVVEFALVVAVAPSLVVVAIFGVARWCGTRVGNWTHAVLLGGLGGLFGNVLVRGLGMDRRVVAMLATVLGVAATVALARAKGGRMLLGYLAMANVLFLFGFLVVSPSSALLSGESNPEALGKVSVPTPSGPVVFIVFDELPMSTLMRADGTINEARYPAFARLAKASTWYRNASTVSQLTEMAVPAIMTGLMPEDGVMPSYQDLPRNMMALMSAGMPVERYEAVTNMCPPEACEARPGQPLRQALSDVAVVFQHRVLPAHLRENLPPIDDAWGSFGQGTSVASVGGAIPDDGFGESNPLARYRAFPASERAPETQAARLVEQGLAVDSTPGFHFVHVVLPHSPWFSTPWGTRVMPPPPDWVEDATLPGFNSSLQLRYQRHSLQVGATDVALGAVIDHLEASGVWDDATVIVTADHGTSTLGPDVGRVATANNADEIYRVPMFIKTPGQAGAVVNDEVAMTIDLLPTLIDLLGIKTDWVMDGHSLVDGSQRRAAPLVSEELAPLLDLVRRHEADFPHGDDWIALAAVGEPGPLVGTALADLEVGERAALSWAAINEASFASLPDEAGQMPQLIVGSITGSGEDPPPNVVLVANGTVAGVARGYRRQDDGSWSFYSMLGPYLREGANQIDAYEVTTVAGRSVLHPLR